VCFAGCLIEDNKKRFLIHFRDRGYRGYSINRFDKPMNKLSQTERDLGGVPSSELILSQHTGQVSKLTSINTLVTIPKDKMLYLFAKKGIWEGMPFDRTLRDWLKFNVIKEQTLMRVLPPVMQSWQ
jgi:hypothetical protein